MVDESITPGKKPDTDTGEASLPLLVDKTGSGPVPGSATSGNPRSNLKYLRFIPLVMLAMAVTGVIALYFQPPGLKLLMRQLNLELQLPESLLARNPPFT